MTLKFKESLSRKGTFKKDIKKDLEEAKKKNKQEPNQQQPGQYPQKKGSINAGGSWVPARMETKALLAAVL